jgi:FKBP-type peptidyl-prolyl cis-trans isomerase SlyD
MKVDLNTVVDLSYTLHLGDGKIIDRSQPNEPMAYLHGYSQIVPGLEAALLGMAEGESKSVVLSPEDGYGHYNADALGEVDKGLFPSEKPLQPGMQFLATAPNGEPTPVTVREINAETILVDFNHPLAGKSLHFAVTVRGVRTATAEELEHKHAHAHPHSH